MTAVLRLGYRMKHAPRCRHRHTARPARWFWRCRLPRRHHGDHRYDPQVVHLPGGQAVPNPGALYGLVYRPAANFAVVHDPADTPPYRAYDLDRPECSGAGHSRAEALANLADARAATAAAPRGGVPDLSG